MGGGDQERKCDDWRAAPVLPQPEQLGLHRQEAHGGRPKDLRSRLSVGRGEAGALFHVLTHETLLLPPQMSMN